MTRFNHKYHLVLLLFFTVAFAEENLYIEKEDDGLYEVTYEKSFYDISDKLTLIIDDYQGNIIINGHTRNNMKIIENCRIKTYSEKDAKQKYHKSKVGFILNEGLLELSGKNRSEKCFSTIELDLPDYTVIRLNAEESEIILRRIDGNIDLKCRDCELVFDNVSSKIDVKAKDTEVQILNCSLVGDLEASRGSMTISSLKSEYFNVNLYGSDLDADKIDSKVTFKTTGGSIYIEESSNDAKLYTAGGDILVERIYGNLACDTKGGTIDVGEVDGICVMECLSGDIYIEEVWGDLKIDAANTDIEVETAHRSVYIETSKRDIEVTKLAAELDKNTILIKNKEGDINLYLDQEINANIIAKINYNTGDEDDWEINSDFPLESTKTESKGKQGFISKKGPINNGGSTIILKNKNGDIYIYEN